MSNPIDLAIDWLADASLTPEQRQIWNRMRTELIDSRTKIEELDKRLKLLQREPGEEMSQTILTRPEFNREVARMLAFDERYGGTSSVLYYDFENIEEIAARYGRSVANSALQDIGKVLMHQVRNSDIVGRLAADEFGVLLVRCDNENAWKKGKLLSQALHDKLMEVHGHKIEIKISYGAYTFRDNEDVGKGIREAAQVVTKIEATR